MDTLKKAEELKLKIKKIKQLLEDFADLHDSKTNKIIKLENTTSFSNRCPSKTQKNAGCFGIISVFQGNFGRENTVRRYEIDQRFARFLQ